MIILRTTQSPSYRRGAFSRTLARSLVLSRRLRLAPAQTSHIATARHLIHKKLHLEDMRTFLSLLSVAALATVASAQSAYPTNVTVYNSTNTFDTIYLFFEDGNVYLNVNPLTSSAISTLPVSYHDIWTPNVALADMFCFASIRLKAGKDFKASFT